MDTRADNVEVDRLKFGVTAKNRSQPKSQADFGKHRPPFAPLRGYSATRTISGDRKYVVITITIDRLIWRFKSI
jgi:hypothetical protein